MTADAGLDVLKPVLNKLGYPLGINEELTRNANGVDLTLRNRRSAYLGIHSSRANDGNINELLDVSNVLKVAVLGHVHRRMRPIPGVVGTVVRVEHVVACVLQIFRCPLGLFHVTSDLNVVLARHRTVAKALHLGLNRVTQRNGIILTASLLDSLNDLSGKAVTVLKASAPLVLSLVEEFNGKLVKKITLVNRVDLNTVNACIAAELRSLCKSLDDLVDLLNRHLGALDVVRPARGLRRGGSKLVARVNDRLNDSTGKFVLVKRSNKLGDRPGATHSGSELNKELRTGLMYLVHKDLELLKHLRILPEPLAPEGVAQRRDSGNDETYVVSGTLEEKLCRLTVEMTARELKPTEKRRATHRAHNDAVLDLNVTDLPRSKQGFVLFVHVFHKENSFLFTYILILLLFFR